MPMFFFSAYCSSIGNHNLLGGAYGDIGSGGKMLNVSLVKTQREEWITHTRLQKLRLNIQYHCRVTYIVYIYNIILVWVISSKLNGTHLFNLEPNMSNDFK